MHAPSHVDTVTGNFVTFGGHAYGRGGGGLHVAPFGQSAGPATAAVQPVELLNTVHFWSRGGGGFGAVLGGGEVGAGVATGVGVGRGGFAMITGDCSCGGGGVGCGSDCSGWPGAAWLIGCDGGVDDDTKHAGTAASVMTNGFANDRRGVRAAMRGRYARCQPSATRDLVRRPSARPSDTFVAMKSVVICVVIALATTAHADKLTGDDLARKNEDGYVTGLPLFAYTTDIGLGAGARAYYFFNGKRDDPRFATTPYLFRTFIQAFVSTRGIQFHWLDFDVPRVADSPFRLRSQLIFQRNVNSNYFGIGKRSLEPLHFPGSASDYSSYSDYTKAQEQIANGTTWGKYDQYDILRPVALLGVERLFADNRIRVLGGLGFSWTRIQDYTGKQVDALDANGNDTTATMGTTRLAADCAAGLVVGCGGGRDNSIRLAFSYDTRDFEPDPNRGVFIDAEVDASTAALGSEFSYVRGMIAARGYYSPIPDRADLVVAGRFVIVGQTNGSPFFSMNTFPFTEDPRTGLGGHRTLRGFRQDRFVGSVMTVANAEVRWTWGHACILKQKLAFMAVPFVDAGRPFDSLGELTYKDWQPTYGAGFRVSWNLATIAVIDYGISREGTGLYINFNHIF